MEVISMDQSSLKEIMKALSMHSEQIREEIRGVEKRMDTLEEKMDQRINTLEKKMDKRFDRLDAKFSGMRVELTESQESIHYLTSKSLQHDRKLRKIHEQHTLANL